MTTNTYNRFQSLVGKTSIDVITITTINGDGTSTGTTLSGASVTVKGTSVSVGQNAFVRAGEIVRQAPNLTPTEMSI